MIQGLHIPHKLAKTPTTDPQFSVEIKGEKLADPRATRAAVALMNQHAVIGGAACHWGGPAAFAEIMSSIHAIMFRKNEHEWYENYNFVNDAGHCENGIYALRALYGFDNSNLETLKGFRSIESKLTGHGEAHLNPEGVYISNGPLGSGIGQAQGLALADKALGNYRTTICTISDGASMEGEAKESFAAIPGLAKKEKLNPFVLIISDNNTKLSGRISDDSFSMNETFESLKSLGWKVGTINDGNNLELVHEAIEEAINKAKNNPSQPVALICKTVKGYGVKSTEESASGGHGYPLKAYDDNLRNFINEIYGGEVPKEFSEWTESILKSKPAPKESQESGVKKEKVQPGFARAATRAAKENLPVFSITSDLQGSTGIAAFHKEFPDRYVDVGVAESNMISTGVGMSKQGMIPIVDTFSQFAITKGNLPLIMSGLSQAPVIGLFSHAGFQDAADGASHQATTYIAATASIPHTKTVVCSCSKEAEEYMYQAIEKIAEDKRHGRVGDSVLFFYGRENHPTHYKEGLDYAWGKPQELISGSDGVIVANGPLVAKALLAADKLKEQGKNVTVINHPFVNEVDVNFFKDVLAKNNNKLVTVEDHQAVGGMGSILVSELAKNGVHPDVRILGIEGKFGQSAYKADQLYALHKLDDNAICDAINSL